MSLLGTLFGLSEIALTLFRRARANEAQAADQGSLWVLWVVIAISINAAFWMPVAAPQLAMEPHRATNLGIALFVAGLTLRWYSIVYLGRFFTVNVAIASDHRLIDTGPYRWIRHPSYTGALLAFAGLGFCMRNWASLLTLLVPATAAFLWRITVEEAALTAALGEHYRGYRRRTKRLVPWLY